ncbi:MAG TPA: M20/M25/M40 family metallo-hydrolase, partial [Candidatus Brocadiia bacterium]|nr:M20/M25/M40 family metallo-hydrolase [Candidatus Brocadiia bacterium]
SAQLDIRFLPGHTARHVQRMMEQIGRDVERDYPDTRFDFKVTAAIEPHESPDHEVIGRLQQAIRDVTGREAKRAGISGASVIKQLVQRGVPAIGVGPGDGAQAHMANESIEVQELLDFTKVLALVAMTCLDGSLAPNPA